VRTYSFVVKAVDPKPLDVEVESYLYGVCRGLLKRVMPAGEGELGCEDIVGFDEEVGYLLGLSYNDVLHGNGSVKVLSYVVPPECTGLIKVYRVADRISNRVYLRFRAYEVSGGEVKLVYSDHFSTSLRRGEVLKSLSEKLGVKRVELEALLRGVS